MQRLLAFRTIAAAVMLLAASNAFAQDHAADRPGVRASGDPFIGMLSTSGSQAIDERRFSGQQASERAGASVSSAGDVNGDGYDDMIVGAQDANGGGTQRGRAYIFFGSATPANRLVNNADVILSGEADLDDFGRAVSGAGDVNGDGYHDVIIGAALNDAAGNSAGRAYIFFGGSAMDATADVVLTGEAAVNLFGGSVSGAGDVNGDGFSDVIVGARANAAGGAGAGRAYIFFGGSAMDAAADVTITGTASDNLGLAVSDAGDVNGDGFGDVVVGADGAGGLLRGEAYIHFGGSAMDNTADVTLTGDAEGIDFGFSVAGVGDVNGDGFVDVAVGDPNYPIAGGDEGGRAYVFLGGSAMDGTADVTFEGTVTFEYYGQSVGAAGDVNGDGYADVIVGAPESDQVTPLGGAAFVFFGSTSMDDVVDVVLGPEAGSAYFGESVGNVGDFNGDGYPDLLVGAGSDDAVAANAGRAYLYMNRMTGFDQADYMFEGASADDDFGRTVSPAGDFNGDGYPDVIVGAYGDGPSIEGRAFIFFGGPVFDSTPDVTFTGENALDQFGLFVSLVGDHNGDGLDDVAVAAPGYSGGGDGRVYVFFGTSSPSGNVAAANADVIYTNTGAGGSVAGGTAGADVNGDGYADVILDGLSHAWIFFGSAAPVDRTELQADVEAPQGLNRLAIGDVNGDGYDDVLGRSTFTVASLNYGGGSPNLVADATINQEDSGSTFGASNTIGDFNGDGLGDLAIGDPLKSLDGSSAGRVYVFFGSANLPQTLEASNADLILRGTTGERLGSSLGVADVNGDGFDDLLVGAPNHSGVASSAGRALVYFGGGEMDETADIVMDGAEADGNLGRAVAGGGDWNGDGIEDVLVGEHRTVLSVPGRAYIYLSSAPAVIPRLTAIVDVPDDQGGHVALKFTRSGYDYPGIDRVAYYAVQRSVPPGGGGFFWEQVATLAPTRDALYGYTASTPNDQTSESNNTYFFRVLAHGVGGEIWKSTHVSASSVDNLSPIPPQMAVAAWQPGGATVSWDENLTDADLREYRVYRSFDQGFTPGAGTLLATTTDAEYFDATVNPAGTYYYLVTAEDIHDNESAPSNEAALDPALAITVAGFSARSKGRSIVLTWRLFDDGEIAGVDIEQARVDGPASGYDTFETAEPVSIESNADGASVARLQVTDYGVYAYRLRMKDKAGVVSYGPVVEISANLDSGFEIPPPYPNPTDGNATIAVSTRDEQEFEIALYDLLGRAVATVFRGNIGSNRTERYEIDGSALAPGLYLIQVRGETFAEIRRLVVR